jgi:hypothetical protein
VRKKQCPLDEADRKARYRKPARGFDEAGGWKRAIPSTAPVFEPADEGGLEIELLATTPGPYSTEAENRAVTLFDTDSQNNYRSGEFKNFRVLLLFS